METILPDFFAGDTSSVQLEFTANGSPIDISGSTLYFSFKKIGHDKLFWVYDPYAWFLVFPSDRNRKPEIAETITTFTDPTNGKHSFSLSSDQTKALKPARYAYDFRRVDASGAVETCKGVCEVLKPVTQI